MTDIPRLRAGGVGGQFWSVYVPVELQGQAAVTATLEADRHRPPDDPEVPGDVRAGADGRRRRADLQGRARSPRSSAWRAATRSTTRSPTCGCSIGSGARYMTLTHTSNTPWADSATDTPKFNGLSPFGEEVVKEMNWLGHAGGPEPRLARHDGGRAPRDAGAGDLLALGRARAERSSAQRARQHPADAAEERRRGDGHVRARVPVAEGQRVEQGCRPPSRTPEGGAPERRRGGEDGASTRGRPPTPRRARRSRTSPTTSITSARSPASITSASAATSTASHRSSRTSTTCRSTRASPRSCCRRGYTRRRHQEDPRPERAARDAGGREGLEEAAGRARAVDRRFFSRRNDATAGRGSRRSSALAVASVSDRRTSSGSCRTRICAPVPGARVSVDGRPNAACRHRRAGSIRPRRSRKARDRVDLIGASARLPSPDTHERSESGRRRATRTR